MTTERRDQEQDEILSQAIDDLADAAPAAIDPNVADRLMETATDFQEAWEDAQLRQRKPADSGLTGLLGLSDTATNRFGDSRRPVGVKSYDEEVVSERVNAVGDLYYIFQHEKIGIFKVVYKLQELFQSGAVYLSGGPGAFALYRFDRREVLRYTERDRWAAYRRAFGYGNSALPPAARPNSDFHGLFTHFNNEVSLFWRDKRISDVMRERAYDPSFGSIAIVRRSGLDLRNNLKLMSYGHLNVLRVEVMQLLEEAFKILGAPDVRQLFGAETAWDVVEIILTQHFKEPLVTSPRQRMAVAGRNVMRWLGHDHILETNRTRFELKLRPIAEYAEEWLTSAQALGIADRYAAGRVYPTGYRFPAAPPASPRGVGPPGIRQARPPARPVRPVPSRNGRRPMPVR
jgi:hypothetical protein